MELPFANDAGFPRLINPRVVPVLPFVVGPVLEAGRRAPAAKASGRGVSVVAPGPGITASGPLIGWDLDTSARAGATVMVPCGLAHPSSRARNADLPAGLAGPTDPDHRPHSMPCHSSNV